MSQGAYTSEGLLAVAPALKTGHWTPGCLEQPVGWSTEEASVPQRSDVPAKWAFRSSL